MLSFPLKVLLVPVITSTMVTMVSWVMLSNANQVFGVSTWEYNLYYLWVYNLVISSSVLSVYYNSTIQKQIFSHLVLLVLALALTYQSTIGGLTITYVLFTVFAIANLVKLLFGRMKTVSFHLPALDVLIMTILLTSVLGTLWILLTAPVYAEGFVILAWAIFALINLLCLVFLYFLSRYWIKTEAVSAFKFNILPTLGSGLFSLALAFAAVYYMVWIEGEPKVALEDQSQWSSAFKPLVDTASASAAQKPLVSKDAFINYLSKQDNFTISQLATLYLLTKNVHWAEKFKNQLIYEAENNAFTGKTGSIKYGQRKFMTRAMYLMEIKKSLPDLLNSEEEALLIRWFETAMRRIFSPEWVDFFYSIPFKDIPDGPYLNQEVGAGTVAALKQVIKDPILKKQAQDFLMAKSSGFRKNYRNPDDSLEYQDVWIQNALSHYLYYLNSDPIAANGLQLAVDWLMQQLPLDASPFGYGLPNSNRPMNTLAIAAFYLKNEQARWLLDKHLLKIMQQNDPLPHEMIGFWLWDETVKAKPFNPGSIILDGPTGYAFRPGPLAADKIVLRSGMTEQQNDHVFVLANLRNIGWHRYPATNTIIRISMDGNIIVGEDIISKKHSWLPSGRAKHRDKKIDRLRLNGLQIKRTGLDAWIGHLTGVYSGWRQDPPRVATVSTNGQNGYQSITSTIANWADTRHSRIYLLPTPDQLLIIDEVISDNPDIGKTINWHTQGFNILENNTLVRELPDNKQISVTMSANQPISIIHQRIKNRYPSAYTDFTADTHSSIALMENKRVIVVTSFSIAQKEKDIFAVKITETDNKLLINYDAGQYIKLAL